MIWILLIVSLSAFGQSGPRDQGVLHLERSPYAKLHPVPVRAVTIDSGFWAARRDINARSSIPSMLQELETHGILDNFRREAGKVQAARKGPVYTDSDIYKWLEAVAFQLQSEPNERLQQTAEKVIDEVAAAQHPDGYLGTFFSGAKRHTDMRHGHELYCLGHLLQAGIAWERATSDRKLLSIGMRMVDYLLANFGTDKKPLFDGHPEIELALIELYRSTQDKKYLDLARYFLDSDARVQLSKRDLTYMNTGRPFAGRTGLEGHAVRAMYAACGAADLYLETGRQDYWKALSSLWDDLAGRQMYITGGIGARSSGEAFGQPYELPNAQAYTESCAAIGSLMWNYRMLHATGEAKYADLLERALYNGINSGMSLTGILYCYRNPLEHSGNPEDRIRNPWYETTCCPPNLERTFSSLPGYFYSTSADGLYVHLYNSNRMAWRLRDGTPVKVKQTTGYPWDGEVKVELTLDKPASFTLYLRIPEWAEGTRVKVNGRPSNALPAAGRYLGLKREWKLGDVVELSFPMQPRLTASNQRLRENQGKVAVERGPLVYCLEGVDQEAGLNLSDVALAAGGTTPTFRERREDELLGGIVTLQTQAMVLPGTDRLYAPFPPASTGMRRTSITLIPYYAFHNRGITPMLVWLSYR